MKAHNLEAIGHLKLSYTPTEPDHAVRLSDLSSATSTSAQPVFITDVVPSSSGNVGNKQYADTVPANQVLLSCVSDTQNLRIKFLAQSDTAFYSPTVSINGTQATNISAVNGDSKMFEGYIDVTVASTSDIVLESSAGSSASVSITVNEFGPSISSLSVDALPVGQTAAKSGDTVDISGTVFNDAVDVSIKNQGAASSGNVILGASDSGGTGLRAFSGTATISSRSGELEVFAVGVNQLGTESAPFASAPITVDQVVPSISFSVVSLSNGLPALGLNDTAEVSISITGQDSQTFEFDHGSEGGSTTEYLTTRILTVTSEVYSKTNNVTITADRSANGASSSSVFSVPVSSIAVVADLVISGVPLLEGKAAVSGYPRVGVSSTNVDSSSEIGALTATSSTDNQMIEINAGVDEFGFFAYPAALGLATFVDLALGTSGGWDGAAWPSDGSTGTTSGPITVQRNGEDWYVYRTDSKGVFGMFQVSLQNPGIPIGSSEPVPHLKTSASGESYDIRVDFDQKVDTSPSLVAPVGTWVNSWSKVNNTTWKRTLSVDNADARGTVQFTGFSATNESGMETTELNSGSFYAVAGFEKLTVTFPAFARIAPIGATVSNVLNTRANYAGATDLLELRTDTRDAQASYSIVDSNGNYMASGGTHIWLSDDQFAASNTGGTLKVEIEEIL